MRARRMTANGRAISMLPVSLGMNRKAASNPAIWVKTYALPGFSAPLHRSLRANHIALTFGRNPESVFGFLDTILEFFMFG
jgi:hypothetical protein